MTCIQEDGAQEPKEDELYRAGWGSPARTDLRGLKKQFIRGDGRNEGNRGTMRLYQNDPGFESRTRCAHPRTKDGAVCRRLMLGMVPSMFGRLNLGQPADDQQTKNK
ncbi:hypothetical protein YTPLAS72_32710 [Nitrospira sp.]|nr:hypothetical protein YTPLAS72_32710 [Nitrospira sp.]